MQIGRELIIDGAILEGGGQILRTSLTLSCLTGKPFRLINIRANRHPPGLKAQHLASVRLAADISQAKISGDYLGAEEIAFAPGDLAAGKYFLDVGTAGATDLILQTIAIPLGFQEKSSQVTLRGGTHVPGSPNYHYLETVWIPFVEQLGYKIRLELHRAGYYPAGGGEITARISKPLKLHPSNFISRGKLSRIRGIAAVSNLDQNIAKRMKHRALSRLEPVFRDTKIKTQMIPSLHPGAFLFLSAEFENSIMGFSGLGTKGKRAEVVADETVDQVLFAISQEGVLDQFMADQILIPLAILNQLSRFTTVKITNHLITNASIVELFLPIKIRIQELEDESGIVELLPNTQG